MLQVITYTHPLVLAAALALLIAVVWAVLVTLRDGRIRTADKVVWTIVLIAFPVIGLALWIINRRLRSRRESLRPNV